MGAKRLGSPASSRIWTEAEMADRDEELTFVGTTNLAVLVAEGKLGRRRQR